MNKMLKMNQRDRDLLQATPLLRGLNPQLAKRILDSATVSSFEAKDILFREGAEADCFFVVLSGYARMFDAGREGREADIAVFGPGETFGECAMFMESRCTFNAQAAEHMILARFDMSRMRQIMAEEPEFAMAIMHVMAHQLNKARANVANDRLHTAPQRVTNYLLEVLNTSPNASGNSFRLPFQKSLLAGKLGLAPEALSRAFSMLKSAGVSVRGRMVQISDAEALRNV